MNRWKNIWNSKEPFGQVMEEDLEQIYRKMRYLDGYDAVAETGDEEGYSWEDLLEQWRQWNRNLCFSKYSDIDNSSNNKAELKQYSRLKNQSCDNINLQAQKYGIKSVFEVGCGSGPNLLLFQAYYPGIKIGGLDYSSPLIETAKRYISSNELVCDEANNLDFTTTYDAVISYSVFHYFPDYEYAWSVLERMYKKSTRVLGIMDIHDLQKKSEFLRHRRELTPDYDIRYSGLEKLFYNKSFFLDFADKYNCDIKFEKSDVKGYWNNKFVYNCYLYKQKEKSHEGS